MNLNKLIRQLLPRGRAFKFPTSGTAAAIIDGINEVYAHGLEDVRSILDSILPDNPNFTAADATVWEQRLGLPASSQDLETRKKGIMRKLNYPGECGGRLSQRYFQAQLQAAGFDVYVYQNKFPDGMGGFMVINPGTGGGGYAEHGVAVHGVDVHGSTGFPYESIIANHADKTFEAPQTYTNAQLRSTFFIGGQVFPNFAAVPASREKEFRKLILTLKAQQTVGYLLINYI